MYEKIRLDNGIRLVWEKIPYVRSVSVGIWVGTGSRNETKSNNGISHFIEHMLFKGTESRSAKEIAESIDNIGGQLNAFTAKECTCYYAKTLDSHLSIAVDVLTDMLFNSTFTKKDIDVERKVILEEIGMYEDSPEELVHDIFSETVWYGNSLGYSILGTQDCLENVDKGMIKEYMSEYYNPYNTVVSVAGNFDEEQLVSMIKNKFEDWKAVSEKTANYEQVEFIADTKLKEKDTEQVHFCMGFKGIDHGNDALYPLLAVNNIFGGGMSSRLFQKIREEMGLVYSIYSYPSSYKNAGLFTIYAGMNPEQLPKVTELICGEIRDLVKNGISPDELQKSKEQLKGNYILGLESTSSRMNSIGKSELMLGRIFTPEETLQKIDRITMESVWQVIDRIFKPDHMSIAAVGNIKSDMDIRTYINL